VIVDPVEIAEPVCESKVEKTFDVPGSVLYRVEAKCPDGMVQVFDRVRAYTKAVEVASDGKIKVSIGAKVPRNNVMVPYPYHYLCDDKVLCVVKINKMNTLSSEEEGYRTFALNYNLFCIDWDACLVMHNSPTRQVYVTSRAEWERGTLESYNREVQMFLKVAEERGVPVEIAFSMMSDGIRKWMGEARAEMVRKDR